MKNMFRTIVLLTIAKLAQSVTKGMAPNETVGVGESDIDATLEQSNDKYKLKQHLATFTVLNKVVKANNKKTYIISHDQTGAMFTMAEKWFHFLFEAVVDEDDLTGDAKIVTMKRKTI